MKTIKNYTIGLLFVVAVCLQSCLSVNEENFYLVTTLDAVVTEEGITFKGKTDKKVFDEAGFVLHLELDRDVVLIIEVEDFHGGMMEVTLPFVYEYEDYRGYKRQIDFRGQVVKYSAFVSDVDYWRDNSDYGVWKELFIPADYNGHAYVDLGLPSGLKWATCNVGATKPEEYGDYFAWGETTPKTTYSWGTYKWCNGSDDTMTKYKYDYVDYYKTVLDLEDDAAAVNMGGSWRMPTDDEWTELRENCTWTWTDDYNGTGVAGRIVTSNINGNSIFLPAGYYIRDDLYYAESYGYYWSSSLFTIDSSEAYGLYFNSGNVDWDDFNSRYFGQSVRGVCP